LTTGLGDKALSDLDLVPDGEWGLKSQLALDRALHRNG
jgi:hypothetical protein